MKYRILNFTLGFFLFSISLIVYYQGYLLYGSDANMLFAMGMVAVLGMMGIIEAFRGEISDNEEKG